MKIQRKRGSGKGRPEGVGHREGAMEFKAEKEVGNDDNCRQGWRKIKRKEVVEVREVEEEGMDGTWPGSSPVRKAG